MFRLVVCLSDGCAGDQKSGAYQYERDDFKSAGPTGRICIEERKEWLRMNFIYDCFSYSFHLLFLLGITRMHCF